MENAKLLPNQALMTRYKGFVRPHLDHGDVIFDEAYNEIIKNQ